MSLVILDYGIGNLRSVQKAFEAIGTPALITDDPQKVAEADRVVLPGVGAFADCMAKYTAAGFHPVVTDHLRQEKPFLGICVGMQMLFTTGYENGTHPGLGIFPGEVVRFPSEPGFKVPHMGWNQVQAVGEHSLGRAVTPGSWFYFVHSYYCVPADPSIIAFETDYVVRFCAAVQRGRLMATQFHPEKSQAAGLQLLKAFTEL